MFTASLLAGERGLRQSGSGYLQKQVFQDGARVRRALLRDVADALVETAKRREELEGQQRRVATSQEALKLTTERFRAGIASYLDVLDSMRSLCAARVDLVTATAARQIGVIQLYQALGGGWTEARSEGAPAPAR